MLLQRISTVLAVFRIFGPVTAAVLPQIILFLIVPNPYSYGADVTNAFTFSGYRNEIQFVNLPPICTLKIYTATGDLIRTIEHTDGSDLERWQDLRTDGWQMPVSGVYILVVDNAKTLTNISLPTRMYKFVIVR